jgi:putative DNA primase/helicase
LKHAVADHHGHAGRAFVALLADTDLQPKLIERLKAMIKSFVDTYVPVDATGQVGRVARRFGLVAAAGELCIELGILPWPEGEAIHACRKCLEAWIELRGGVGCHEAEQAIAKVKRFIELNGESRFTPMDERSESHDSNAFSKTNQRAGFRQKADEGRTEFFILPETYRNEICAGLNPAYVTGLLVERGFLGIDSKGNPQVEKRLPGIGKKRVYHLTANFMEDGVSQAEKYETVVRQSRTSKIALKYKV